MEEKKNEKKNDNNIIISSNEDLNNLEAKTTSVSIKRAAFPPYIHRPMVDRMHSFAQIFKETPNIKKLDLDLSFNYEETVKINKGTCSSYLTSIVQELVQELVLMLKNFPNLEEVYLNFKNNYITDAEAIAIAQALAKLPKLQKINLNFSDNNITDIGAITMAEILKDKKNVEFKFGLSVSTQIKVEVININKNYQKQKQEQTRTNINKHCSIAGMGSNTINQNRNS